MAKGKTANKGKGVPHPNGVYHRYTWMGNGWTTRAMRRAGGKK
jgi:hypothetical protein